MKLRFAVNCSIMLTRMSISDRLAAVRAAGIDAVEFWWPFEAAAPPVPDVDYFIRVVRRSGLQLVGLNLFAGDLRAGDRGVVSWPGREPELRANLEVVLRIGEELNCQRFNALYGNRQPGFSAAEQDAVALRTLGLAAAELAKIGGTVLVEPVSGADAYPLKSADQAVAILDRMQEHADAPNVGFLLDVYHLAANGDDVSAAIARHFGHIAHVQLADAPGRGAPGTGELPLGQWVDELLAAGYDGWYALEHLGEEVEVPSWQRHETGRSS